MNAWRNAVPAMLLALVCAGPVSAQVTRLPAPTTATRVIQQPQTGGAVVSAAAGWTQTGVTLRAGEELRINAQGTWSQGGAATAAVASVGPAGYPNQRNTAALMPSAPVGALIGRIGSGQPFLIGASSTITAPAGGVLSLAFNDDPAALKDNTGRVAASISVTPATTQASRTPTTPTDTAQPAQPTRPNIADVIPGILNEILKQRPQQTQPTAPPATDTPTDKPPTTRPPADTPATTPTTPTAPPATRPPRDPPPTRPPVVEPPVAKPPATETPVVPEPRTPEPPATEVPPTPVEQPATPPPVEPPATTPPPATPVTPALPFNPILLIGAVVALGALLLGLRALNRGQRNADTDAATGPPRVSARLGSDGRTGQMLSVKWRRRT